MEDKLQKLIAATGMSSRREAEKWIEQGRVSVNGTIATLGDRASAKDKIRIDGKLIKLSDKKEFIRRLITYHKPVGEVCTRKDPENRPTVFDNLPSIRNGRWLNIGRLDINTSGLLIFTNDGELANRLMHPSYEVVRKYAVRVRGQVTDEMVKQLMQGIVLEDGMAKFETVQHAGGEGSNQWYHVSLKEGKNREVRRLWESLGVQVSRLQRIQYGPCSLLRSLRSGRWQEMTTSEINLFEDLVGLPRSINQPAKINVRRKQTKKFMKARR